MQAASPIGLGFVVVRVGAVLDGIEVHATKLGMLTNARIVEAVASLVVARWANLGFLVLDPVMVMTSGNRLLVDGAAEVARIQLLPLANLITPNIPKAAVLAGSPPVGNSSELQTQAEHITTTGTRMVLAKGGHLAGEELTDLLVTPNGIARFTDARMDTRSTHDARRTLSSTITVITTRAGIALDSTISERVIAEARDFLHRTILTEADWQLSRSPGTRRGPVNHLTNLKEVQA